MSTRLRTWNNAERPSTATSTKTPTAPTTTTSTAATVAAGSPRQDAPLEAGSWIKQPRTPPPSRHMDDQRRDPHAMQRRARDKARRHALSVCVSSEEEEILRGAAYEAGLNFSEWARESLFAAAKKRIPSRSRKVES